MCDACADWMLEDRPLRGTTSIRLIPTAWSGSYNPGRSLTLRECGRQQSDLECQWIRTCYPGLCIQALSRSWTFWCRSWSQCAWIRRKRPTEWRLNERNKLYNKQVFCKHHQYFIKTTTQNSLFLIGVTLSKMFRNDSKFTVFDRGYPQKSH